MNDPLASLPGYALRRASSAMLADLGARLAELDLRPTDAATLVLIEANPGIKQSDLCIELDMQRANMTPLIARLEGRGLISREAIDGRSQGLALTTVGATLTAATRIAMQAHENYLMARIPAAHREHFLSALDALWRA